MIKIKCILLCAGYATRLYPLTIDTPKSLLDIAGKPVIEHILEKIYEIPVNEIFVVTNSRFYDKFNEWLSNYNEKIPIKVINDKTNNNEERLGALGDIHFVIQNQKINDDILIIAGDNIFEDSLAGMNSFFKDKKMSIIGLHDVKNLEVAKRMGVVSLDKNNKLIEFAEKPKNPKSTIVSALIYFIKKDDVQFIKECLRAKSSEKEVKAGEFIEYIINKTSVYGYVLKKNWFDIGDYEQLKKADKVWKGK